MKTKLIRWQKIVIIYVFIHCIVKNSLKLFTANWKKGNRPVVFYNLLIIFLKQFLKMVVNGLFIEPPYSFNIRILTQRSLNMARWWLAIDGFYPRSHNSLTLWSREVMWEIKNIHISTSTIHVAAKLGMLEIYHESLYLIKLLDP